MSKLEKKVAVITGGNSGIGLATAQTFKNEGAIVVTNARNQQRLEETQADHGDLFDDVILADVTKVDQLESLFNSVGEKYGQIDVLFLNAGIAKFLPIEHVDDGFYNAHFDTNVRGIIFGVQKALPYLKEGSSIILTTSVVNQMGMANSSVYAATKAAVRSLAQSLSAELVDRGIRVNAVSPGPIETPIFGKMELEQEQIDEMAQGILGKVPLKRFGTSEEVAKAALFLASNDSSFVVGAEIEVDGGMATLG